MPLSEQTNRGIRWNAVALGLSITLTYLQAIVVACYLSPAEYGIVAVVILVVGLVDSVSDFGLSGAIVQRPEVTDDELSTLFWIHCGIGVLAAGVVGVLAYPLATWTSDAVLSELLPVASIGFPVAGASIVWRALFMREMRFRALAVVNIVEVATRCVLACVLAVQGYGVYSVVVAHVVSIFAGAAVLVAVGARRFLPRARARRADLSGYLQFGLFQLGTRIVGYAALRIDQVLVRGLLGGEALGYYYLARQLVDRIRDLVNQVIMKIAFPVLSRLQDDPGALRREYLEMLRLTMAANAPLLLGIAALAPGWISAVLGPQWEPAATVVQISALLALVRGQQGMAGVLAFARGRAGLAFAFSVTYLLLDSALVTAGSLTYGLLGALSFLAAGEALFLTVSYRLGIAPLVGACSRDYIAALVRPVLLATAMAGLVLLVEGVRGPSFAWIGVEIAAGAAVYLGLSWVFQRETTRDVLRIVRGAVI